jgi:hypothetical protein
MNVSHTLNGPWRSPYERKFNPRLIDMVCRRIKLPSIVGFVYSTVMRETIKTLIKLSLQKETNVVVLLLWDVGNMR